MSAIPQQPAPDVGRVSWQDEYRRLRKAGVPQAEALARAHGVAPRSTVAASAPPDISRAEAIGRGAVQGATLGYGDEMAGNAAVAATGPSARGLPPGMPTSADPNSPLPRQPDTRAADAAAYAKARDANRSANEAAQKAHGGYYLGGEMLGGAASAAALPATETLGGAAALGAGYGAAAGLGSSKAEIAHGEYGQAAADTATGAAIGAAAGAGANLVSKGVDAGRRVLAATLSKHKMIGALTSYLENITTRNGDPAMAKQAAGKLMNAARDAAGDIPLVPSHFMRLGSEVYRDAQNPAAGGLSAEARQVIDDAQRLADREGGPSLTLTELDNALKTWGARVKDWGSDPAKQRVAVMARNALRQDLDAATGNKTLGKAADLLAESRTQYAKAARDADLQQLLTKAENPASLEQYISPGKFARLNSGANRAKVDRLLSGDQDAAEAWRMGVDAAKAMGVKNESWLPEMLQKALPEKTVTSFKRLMTYRNVTRVFTDPDNARDYARLVSPEIGANTKEAIDIIGRLAARIGIDNTQAGDAEQPTATRRGGM